MKQNLLIRNTRNFLLTGFFAAMTWVQGQEPVIIYQQNFDGSNGDFTNTIVSQNTETNGWISSSTEPQYGDVYRHMWNFSDVSSGSNPLTMPISGRSMGMGFYNGNDPWVPNEYFHYYAAEPADQTFYTTRWAHIGISTEGYENITIEFKWKCAGELFEGVVYDYGTVNTSIDGGATWAMDQTGGQGGTTSEHGNFNGGLYFGNEGVQTAILTLPETRDNQPDFRLAFRMVVDEGYGTGGGFIIDDIIVRGTLIEELGTSDLSGSGFKVYKDGGDFVVKSSSKNIQNLEVYDLSGKLIISLKDNRKEIRIKASQLAKGVHVVKAGLENGEVLTQKIVK